MNDFKAAAETEFLQLLPSVDAVLRVPSARAIEQEIGIKHLTKLTRTAVNSLRREISTQTEHENFSRENLLEKAAAILENLHRQEKNAKLRRVINAAGVIVHTNLGRAPLSENAQRAILDTAGYCNLEYDLGNGRRGRRGARVENLLAEITGAGGALVVNNCAAAAFLVLKALAAGGETVLSRGELVEIGGDFRVPDVMAEAGTILREVGTTNRTKIADYEKAITENTKLFLKVHPSNYRIIGFTKNVSVAELSALAKEKNILVYEDAGSGALVNLSDFGLTDEPVISESIADGADVVTFSGDKLLGGAQAGLVVGRMEMIEKIRAHPLYRALRAGKMIYAALEATLEAFQKEKAFEEIPVLRMLAATAEEMRRRTENFARTLDEKRNSASGLSVEVKQARSVVGGGSAPDVAPETYVLALKRERTSVSKLENMLRRSEPPVIARVTENEVLIDLRTVSEGEEGELLEILAKI